MPGEAPRGRGSAENPNSRFSKLRYEADADAAADLWDDSERDAPSPQTVVEEDGAKSVLSRNDSPDVPFDWSLNPYRGCEHGCAYCYARPTHEYLGLSAGLDFETRLLAKPQAAELLAQELAAPGWERKPIALSGVTDPYQPIERERQLTRRCLEVLVAFRNPVWIVTKSDLVLRDIDLLSKLAAVNAVHVAISVTTLDRELARTLEPRACQPRRRLDALARLSAAGIPTGVLAAPLIPGLNDHELPSILEEAAKAGARRAGYVLLRLPHGLKELFAGWLDRHRPLAKARVLGALEEMRGGKLNDPRFRSRMQGEGARAAQLARWFEVLCGRLRLERSAPKLSSDAFVIPGERQRLLFE
ncbi:MAG: PA0069 family radical SAM protein [Planctomycetes bacterium]|nr:PA0069 family radical SAM protein [Planctomycetota bacterium]